MGRSIKPKKSLVRIWTTSRQSWWKWKQEQQSGSGFSWDVSGAMSSKTAAIQSRTRLCSSLSYFIAQMHPGHFFFHQSPPILKMLTTAALEFYPRALGKLSSGPSCSKPPASGEQLPCLDRQTSPEEEILPGFQLLFGWCKSNGCFGP